MPSRASWWTVAATVGLLVSPSFQQKDSLKDFCRRWGHQTCVIDDRLFIDGGYLNYNPLEQNPLNYTNTGLQYADLNVDNEGMPQNYNNLTKSNNAPSVAGGILWPDQVNKKFYLYGGEFQTSPQSFSMWYYDAIYDKWESMNPDVTQAQVQRAAWGAGVAVDDRAYGYYYGGWLSNSTVPTWSGEPIALSNLLKYDMVQNTWTNSTGPDTIGRAEGVMVYIPASDGGQLIYFGGVQMPYSNGTWVGQRMDEIFIYDIGNSKWYTQSATGNVPEMRRRFCGGVTWAKDQSSYNIYLYGGASMPPLTVGFDDVYILTIPAFEWIKWYPDKPGAAYPHHSLSCNVINGNQMLVMGGTFPNSSTCDVPTIHGFHNMDMGKQNDEGAKWALFQNNKTGYKVPNELIDVVGGGANGGASKKSPEQGWSNPDLGVYYTRQYKVATTRTATRDIPATNVPKKPDNSGSKPKGAIIGGAVAGGVVVLVLLGALVFFCLRKRKSSAQQQQTHAQHPYHPAYNQVSPTSPGMPHYGYQPNQLHPPQQAPVQLPTNEAYVSELPAEDAHKSWGGATAVTSFPSPESRSEKSPSYNSPPATTAAATTAATAAAAAAAHAHSPNPSGHVSSPSQSPPPAGGSSGYFPTPNPSEPGVDPSRGMYEYAPPSPHQAPQGGGTVYQQGFPMQQHQQLQQTYYAEPSPSVTQTPQPFYTPQTHMGISPQGTGQGYFPSGSPVYDGGNRPSPVRE